MQLFSNNGSSTLAAPFSIGDGALVIQTGDNIKFPNPDIGDPNEFMVLTIQNAAGDFEIVVCQGTAGDTFDIPTRAAEGTSEQNWNTGDRVELRNTAGMLDRTLILNEAGELDRGFDMTGGVTIGGVPNSTVDGEVVNHEQFTELDEGVAEFAGIVNRTMTAFAIGAGTEPNWTATFATPLQIYNLGQRIVVKAPADVDATTDEIMINVDGLGARSLLREGGFAVMAWDITDGMYMDLMYCAQAGSSPAQDFWQLMNPAGPSFSSRVAINNALQPIGAVLYTTDNVNPGARFFGQTWNQIAQGRFVVGVGKGTDDNGHGRTYPEGIEVVGEYVHELTESEMPSHDHGPTDIVNGSGSYVGGGYDGGGNHYVSDTDNAGGGQVHENSPPGYGLYVWTRTA
jgi:hypothetical protein